MITGFGFGTLAANNIIVFRSSCCDDIAVAEIHTPLLVLFVADAASVQADASSVSHSSHLCFLSAAPINTGNFKFLVPICGKDKPLHPARKSPKPAVNLTFPKAHFSTPRFGIFIFKLEIAEFSRALAI